MTDIIRPLTFVNKNQSPKVTRAGLCNECQFICFGQHDFLKVGKNLLCGKEPEHLNKKLLETWEKTVKVTEELDGNTTRDIVFLMRTEEDDEISESGFKEDKDFWEGIVNTGAGGGKKECWFLFITFIQLNRIFKKPGVLRRELEKEINEKIKEYERKKKEEFNTESIIYLTPEQNDFVVVTKSQDYDHGFAVAEGFCSDSAFIEYNPVNGEEPKARFKHTYTVFAMPISLTDKEKFKIEEYKENLEKEEPYKVCGIDVGKELRRLSIRISSAENNITDWLKQLKDAEGNNLYEEGEKSKIIPYSVPGNDDYVLEINNIKWADLISWHMEDGFFDPERICDNSQKWSIVSFVFKCVDNGKGDELDLDFRKFDDKVKKELAIASASAEKRKGKDHDSYFAKCLEEKRKQMSGKFEEFHEKTRLNVSFQRTILFLLNSMPKLENARGFKYDYAMLVKPLITVIEMIDKGKNTENKLYDPPALLGDYLRFMCDINTVLQNDIRGNWRFNVSPDINMSITDAPHKFICASSAFLSKLLEALSIITKFDAENQKTCQKTYVELLVPVSADQTHIDDIFYNYELEERIFSIFLSTRSVYDLAKLWFEITHETFHVAGGELRMRPLRKECMIETLANLFANYYLSKLEDCIKSKGKSVPDEIKNNRKEIIELYVKRSSKSMVDAIGESNKKLNDVKEEDLDRVQHLGQALHNAVYDDRNHYRRLLKCITDVIKNPKDKDAFYRENLDLLREAFEDTDDVPPSAIARSDFNSITYDVYDIFCEIHADVFSILCLGIKPEQYFRILITEKYLRGGEKDVKDVIRFWCVKEWMREYSEDGWNEDKVNGILNNIENSVSLYKRDAAIDFRKNIKNIEKEESKIISALFSDDVYGFRNALKPLKEYIGECYEYFKKQKEKDDRKDAQSIIEDLTKWYGEFWASGEKGISVEGFVDTIYELNYGLHVKARTLMEESLEK